MSYLNADSTVATLPVSLPATELAPGDSVVVGHVVLAVGELLRLRYWTLDLLAYRAAEATSATTTTSSYSAQDLDAFFDIALESEYGVVPATVKKWVTGIAVYFFGANGDDIASFGQIAGEVSAISGITITQVDSITAANLIINFAPASSFPSFVPGAPTDRRYWMTLNVVGAIQGANIVIEAGMGPDDRKKTMWHCLYQAMGLLGATAVSGSILGVDVDLLPVTPDGAPASPIKAFTSSDQDKRLMAILYDERLTSGMLQSQVNAALTLTPLARTATDLGLISLGLYAGDFEKINVHTGVPLAYSVVDTPVACHSSALNPFNPMDFTTPGVYTVLAVNHSLDTWGTVAATGAMRVYGYLDDDSTRGDNPLVQPRCP